MTRDRHEVDKEEEKREGPKQRALFTPSRKHRQTQLLHGLLTFLDLAQLHLNVVARS